MNNMYTRIIMLFLAAIIGYRLLDHFDYDSLTFEKPWMDIMYGIGFFSALFIAFHKISRK